MIRLSWTLNTPAESTAESRHHDYNSFYIFLHEALVNKKRFLTAGLVLPASIDHKVYPNMDIIRYVATATINIQLEDLHNMLLEPPLCVTTTWGISQQLQS